MYPSRPCEATRSIASAGVRVQQRAELHPELRLDGLQFASELDNLFVLPAHLLPHRLMQPLDCGERDTFDVLHADTPVAITEAEGRVENMPCSFASARRPAAN